MAEWNAELHRLQAEAQKQGYVIRAIEGTSPQRFCIATADAPFRPVTVDWGLSLDAVKTYLHGNAAERQALQKRTGH